MRSLVRPSSVSPLLLDYPRYPHHHEVEKHPTFAPGARLSSRCPTAAGLKRSRCSGERKKQQQPLREVSNFPKSSRKGTGSGPRSIFTVSPFAPPQPPPRPSDANRERERERRACRSRPRMSPSARASLFLACMVIQGLRVGGSPSCANCGLPPVAGDAEQRLMVEVAKQQLLDKLHLKERPNITQAVPRAALLTALRKLHSGRVRQDGTLELENNLPSKDQGYEIVSFADIREVDRDQASLGLTFQFLQESSQSIQVLQSSLWIYIRSPENPRRDSRITAQVFLSAVDDEGDVAPDSNRTLLIKKTLEVRESNWHTFPVGRTLQAYLDGGRSRLRLEVTCERDGRNLCAPEGSADSPHRPFMVAKVRLLEQGARHALQKRSLRCGEDVTVCCKKDFYVKFKDIQWSDWIIAPDGYHMNYCAGQCSQHLSGTPGISSSFHASVFSQLKVSGVPTAMSSCCIPTERQALSIVYFNSQHSIVKTDIPDMIVEACGCT